MAAIAKGNFLDKPLMLNVRSNNHTIDEFSHKKCLVYMCLSYCEKDGCENSIK